jgi:uncharacterized protein with ParB-like and HNH nuclease domain
MLNQPVRTNVSDFIKQTMGSQFVIPVYQRNYTWNPETETARYMNDMENLLSHRTEDHFLGILIYLESDVSAMFKQILIVDGQQRLTTSFLFLLSLKKAAQEKNDENVVGMIDDYYLYNRHALDEAKLRLKPTVSDDNVYAKLIYGQYKELNKKEKESNVCRNYEYIYRRIVEYSKHNSLMEILDCLSRMDLLIFPLSKNDNAQQIFESINSTGAPLTAADLIRNYILMNGTNEVQEHYYKLYWAPLENYYPDSHRLEEFFRFYLAAKTYNLLSKRDVYDGFKDFWNESKDSVENRLKEINRYCRYYYTIYNGASEDAEIESCLADYRLNDSKMPAPFLMEMFRLYDDGKITAETLCAQIRLIDSYLTRRALCGNDTGAISRYFPTLLRSVMNSYSKSRKDIHEITKTALINYNRGKALAMPTDDQLRAQLKEINAYSLMCIRAVLERIEHFGSYAKVDTDDLNIEHIMPQHPNTYWKKASGNADDDTYTFYANLIGNLTLCAEYDNTRMGNQDFTFKKQILANTLHIRMNTEILKKNSWTPQDILKRCDELTDAIIRIYPYEGGKAALVEKDDDIIVLNAPSVSAKALYHAADNIEILSGSTMKAYGPNEMRTMRQLFRQLSEQGVLSEDENGQIQFDRDYQFADLNTAAQFLLHRGGSNEAAWTRENGTAMSAPAAGKSEPAAVKPAPVQPQPKPQPVQKPQPQKQQPQKQQSKPQPQKPQKQQPKQQPKPAAESPAQTAGQGAAEAACAEQPQRQWRPAGLASGTGAAEGVFQCLQGTADRADRRAAAGPGENTGTGRKAGSGQE